MEVRLSPTPPPSPPLFHLCATLKSLTPRHLPTPPFFFFRDATAALEQQGLPLTSEGLEKLYLLDKTEQLESLVRKKNGVVEGLSERAPPSPRASSTSTPRRKSSGFRGGGGNSQRRGGGNGPRRRE